MRKSVRVAVVVLATVLVGACTPSEPDPTTSPSPTATTSTKPSPTPLESPSPSASPSPSPTAIESFPDDTSGDTPEQAEIRAGWQAYVRVVDKFARNPFVKDLTETQHVTTGQEANDIVESVQWLRDNNLVREGDVVYRDTVISEPMTNRDGVTTATVSHCMDPSNMRTVDAQTGEEGEVTLTETMKVTHLMEKMPDGSWRAALETAEISPC